VVLVTEIQRVRDPEIIEEDWLEVAISEWYTGVTRELMGALQQMRAAAYAKAKGGREGLETLAEKVGAKKSKAYAFAATYERLANEYGEELSARVEASPSSVWQVVESVHNGAIQGDIRAAWDKTDEENTSVRELRSERGEQKNVETITEFICPSCGEVHPVSSVETRTREVARDDNI
jgi:hypothetical protein